MSEPSAPAPVALWPIPLKTWVFSIVAAVMVAADQITKWLVMKNIEIGDEVKVIDGFFSLTHAKNTGAALGFLGEFSYRMWVFGAFTLIAMGVLINMVRQLPRRDVFQSAMIGLIFSGAIGNAVDRAIFGRVTDFLRVYTEVPTLRTWLVKMVGTNEYPTFNVADSAIVVGVALFLLRYLFVKDPPKAS